MTQYFNLVVLSPPNEINDTKHDIVIISVVTLTYYHHDGSNSTVVLICKWKIRHSSEI